MKKIFYHITVFIFLINILGCAGYKPIFQSEGFNFKIRDYKITGNKNLGNQIYSNLYGLSKASKENSETKNIYLLINVDKNKVSTSKDSTGKILAYKVTLKTKISMQNISTGNTILNENFVSSFSYKVQDKYSETIDLENDSMENQIDEIYNDLLIKLSEKISE